MPLKKKNMKLTKDDKSAFLSYDTKQEIIKVLFLKYDTKQKIIKVLF